MVSKIVVGAAALLVAAAAGFACWDNFGSDRGSCSKCAPLTAGKAPPSECSITTSSCCSVQNVSVSTPPTNEETLTIMPREVLEQ